MRLVYLLLPLSLGLPITIPVKGTEVYQLQRQLQRPEYQQEQQQTILAQNHSENDHPSSTVHGSFINLDLNLLRKHSHSQNHNNTRNATLRSADKDKILQAYLHTLHTSHLTAHTFSKYTPELLALALFSLLPLTLAILALAERIARSWTVEAYPERGRDRRRFLGRERRCLMLARREREKRALMERGWWVAERKR